MRFVKTIQNVPRSIKMAGWLLLCLSCMAGTANAQSTDIASPTAVRTTEVLGTIVARDIGDPRVTDHFYTFTGMPGDLLITVEGRNLNGDVDVFTATGLHPLLKFTVYAGSSSPVTKSIYLKTREPLILRIEGRTPNDDEATYQIHFGGSFEPIIGGPDIAASTTEAPAPDAVTAAVRSSLKKGKRVSSAGARLPEPPPTEVAAAPAPQPTPVESPTPAETKAEVPKSPERRGRGRRPGRSARPSRRAAEETAAAKTEPGSTPTAPSAGAEIKPTPARRRGAGRSATARDAVKPPAAQEPESGPRLIIETNDGTLINRYMSTVRRVIVENGQVVVVGRDGKIERIKLESVVRMSISPE